MFEAVRLRSKGLSFVALMLLFLNIAAGQEFKGEERLRQLFADLFKVQFSGYQFLGVPQARFGVGTMYAKGFTSTGAGSAAGARRLFLGDLDSWWASNVPVAERQRLKSTIVVEGPLGFQKVVAPVARNVKVNLALPFVFLRQLGTAKVDIDKLNNATVTVTADTAAQRVIDFGAFFDAVNSGKVRPDIAKVIKAGDYLIVNEDLVLYGFEAVVESQKQSKIAIGIQIAPAAQTKVDAEGAKQAGDKKGSSPASSVNTELKGGEAKAETKTSPSEAPKKEPSPAQTGTATANVNDEPRKGELRLGAPTGSPAPMIVGVLLSNGLAAPSSGALSSAKLTPASVDSATLSQVMISLEMSIPLPNSVSVIAR
jgi:hypothetical protein